MTGFLKAVAKFGKKAIEQGDRIKKHSAIDVYSLAILATPVKEGILRGNWVATVEKPYTGISDRPQPDPKVVINKMKVRILTASIGDVLYLSNNVPYATVIDAGRTETSGSVLAREGMTKPAIEQWDNIVMKNARKYGN
ncbi:neck protein [Vibrio phage 2.117.O._10N.261.45.E9]|nr:neck protein [Vibrio phage 1.117.O._10N.261.45.E9]AUR95436.1 neck protein [Vibrio phage 1.207.B._10N.222.51.C2]AUS02327.1 neck protein [Vibrio phage 2.117.O._10N.261.45.E9]